MPGKSSQDADTTRVRIVRLLDDMKADKDTDIQRVAGRPIHDNWGKKQLNRSASGAQVLSTLLLAPAPAGPQLGSSIVYVAIMDYD